MLFVRGYDDPEQQLPTPLSLFYFYFLHFQLNFFLNSIVLDFTSYVVILPTFYHSKQAFFIELNMRQGYLAIALFPSSFIFLGIHISRASEPIQSKLDHWKTWVHSSDHGGDWFRKYQTINWDWIENWEGKKEWRKIWSTDKYYIVDPKVMVLGSSEYCYYPYLNQSLKLR